MYTAKDIISRFGTAAALARKLGRPESTVRQWGNRNSIPRTHWPELIGLAERSGVSGIDYESLAKIGLQKSEAA